MATVLQTLLAVVLTSRRDKVNYWVSKALVSRPYKLIAGEDGYISTGFLVDRPPFDQEYGVSNTSFSIRIRSTKVEIDIYDGELSSTTMFSITKKATKIEAFNSEQANVASSFSIYKKKVAIKLSDNQSTAQVGTYLTLTKG